MTYKDAIGKFAKEMRTRMLANKHKKGWLTLPTEYCFKRTCDELYELEEALRTNNTKRIKEEAADCANFLMMLYHSL